MISLFVYIMLIVSLYSHALIDFHAVCVYGSGDHRSLHVLTHSVPARRSSDLLAKSLGIRADAVVGKLASQVGDTGVGHGLLMLAGVLAEARPDRKSTLLNSSH